MKSTRKVFQVLETLCEGKSAGVSELSQLLDIKPSSVHRFLAVLTDLGYVQKDEQTGKYIASLKVFQLGVAVRNKLSLISIARPHMEELCESLHETVNIAIFTGDNVVVIDRVQSPAALRTNIVVGRNLPAYCTAFGKVFLAEMKDDDFEAYLSRQDLKPLTRQTLATPKALRPELEKIRAEGYAIDNRELDDNIRCIAAPLRDESGKAVAAVSVSGPASRLKMVRVNTLTKTVQRTTDAISRDLGYRSDFPGNQVE